MILDFRIKLETYNVMRACFRARLLQDRRLAISILAIRPRSSHILSEIVSLAFHDWL